MAYDSARHPKSKTGAEFSLVVKNGSKIRGTLCRAIPLPLSATVIRSVRALCYLNKWHPLISTRVTEIMNTTRL